MYTCMCNWVTRQCSRKLTEHYKTAMIEKNKNHYIKKKLLFCVLLRSSCCRLSIGATLFRKEVKAVWATLWDPLSSNFSLCNED